MAERELDVAIAGAGPVARALALALEGGPLAFALIGTESPGDERPIALSYGSRLILERLGAWPRVAATPIERIEVTQRGDFGSTRFDREELDLPALGYVSTYAELIAALAPASSAIAARLLSWESARESVRLVLDDGARLRARLLVLAEGSASGCPERVSDYRQQALVCTVRATRPRPATAFERFTAEGPLALLPLRQGWSVVWSARPETVAQLIALPEAQFCARLEREFGRRLGRLSCAAPRRAYPLALRRRPARPAPRVLTAGNAAQTLHPVAGQGLNLGLRDAWELARMLLDSPPERIGEREFGARYAARRRTDRAASVIATDFLARIFTASLPTLSLARGAALAALDVLPPMRRFFARRMIFGARALP